MSRASSFSFPLASGRTLTAGAREAVRLAIGQLGRPTHIQVGSASAELIWERDGCAVVRLALRRAANGLWRLHGN
jgi:hypothetical protein